MNKNKVRKVFFNTVSNLKNYIRKEPLVKTPHYTLKIIDTYSRLDETILLYANIFEMTFVEAQEELGATEIMAYLNERRLYK